MKKPIQVIFSDLDGTLFYGGPALCTMTKENEDAIVRWTEAGNRFIIATGRPASIKDELVERHHIQCDILACNGAKVILNDQLLWSKEVGPQETREIMEICEPYGNLVDFALDMDWIEWVVYHRGGLVEKKYPDANYNTTVEQYLSKERDMYANKIYMICANQEVKSELMEKLSVHFEGRLAVTSSATDNIELGCPGVSKDVALLEILKQMNLDVTQAAAIGDEVNDLTMLKCIPYGFVMSSARDEIRKEVPREIESVAGLIDWCLAYNETIE